jgi:hypothetical protein
LYRGFFFNPNGLFRQPPAKNLLIQNEDVLFNPKNPVNPDSKSGESG